MKLQRGGFVIGMVVGLLVGLAVALAVALYITKTPVPFVNKVPQRSAEQDAAEAERNKNWDPNAPLAGKTAAKPAMAASDAAVAPTGAASPAAATAAPVATTVPAHAPGAASAAAANPPPATAVASAPRSQRDPAAILAGQGSASAPTGKAAPAAATTFFVQAGAYAKPEDAEAQRAKLALMGLTAKVTEREQSGRTVYRVRVGPVDAREEAEDIQGKLGAAGIDSNLVRVER
jgi:cell division protein FtsN